MSKFKGNGVHFKSFDKDDSKPRLKSQICGLAPRAVVLFEYFECYQMHAIPESR